VNYIKQAVAYLKSHWVTVVMLGVAMWNYAEPTVTDYVHNHPKLSFWYGLAAVVVAFYIRRGTLMTTTASRSTIEQPGQQPKTIETISVQKEEPKP
jgi:hypothetical protein